MVETLHRPWQDVEITDKFGTQSIMAPQHTTGKNLIFSWWGWKNLIFSCRPGTGESTNGNPCLPPNTDASTVKSPMFIPPWQAVPSKVELLKKGLDLFNHIRHKQVINLGSDNSTNTNAALHRQRFPANGAMHWDNSVRQPTLLWRFGVAFASWVDRRSGRGQLIGYWGMGGRCAKW